MQPFYVGKGKQKRAYLKTGRTQAWHNIVNNCGYKVNIIQKDLTEQQAFNGEKLTIAALSKFNKLVNLSFGGGGCAGWKHTIKTKEKQKIGLINSYTLELRETRRKFLLQNQPTKNPEVIKKMKKPKSKGFGLDHFRAKQIKYNNIIYPTISAFCKENNLSLSTYKYRARNNILHKFGIELICH